MKYSILIPYYNRAKQFAMTLASFHIKYSRRKDYEIIIIEDAKNEDRIKFILKTYEHLPILFFRGDDSPNPSSKYNYAAKIASGEFLVITSPECFHKSNILKALDEEFSLNPSAYIVCACEHVNEDFKRIKWYQHSVENPRKFHFCSAISRSQYLDIHGFDERFSDGIAYDDAAFLKNIKRNNIKIIERDDAIVLHQAHDKYGIDRKDLVIKNKLLYQSLYE